MTDHDPWKTHIACKILHSDGSLEDGSFDVTKVPPYAVKLNSGAGTTEFNGRDLFEALIELRRELEKKGAVVLCAGARRDVFPSGMGRSMGAGRKAYVLRLGVHSKTTDLVDIFDSADAQLIGTVEEQNQFHENWIQSRKI